MIVDGIQIDSLLRAFSKFENFRKNITSDQEKAGAVQAFEYSFELAWKMMKRLLEVRGKIANSPRETFRMAGLEGFIDDVEVWFDFIKKRNATVHTYCESEMEDVVSGFDEFSRHVNIFLTRIQNTHTL